MFFCLTGRARHFPGGWKQWSASKKKTWIGVFPFCHHAYKLTSTYGCLINVEHVFLVITRDLLYLCLPWVIWCFCATNRHWMQIIMDCILKWNVLLEAFNFLLVSTFWLKLSITCCCNLIQIISRLKLCQPIIAKLMCHINF